MLTMFHECGGPLLVDSQKCGDVFLTRFFDGREEGQGKKLTNCPACFESLGVIGNEGQNAAYRLCPDIDV